MWEYRVLELFDCLAFHVQKSTVLFWKVAWKVLHIFLSAD
jgi:hypothetical protein